MKQKLLLFSMLSMSCWGISAEVVQKSFEKNLKWEGAYVICEDESITYTYLKDDGSLLSEPDVAGISNGKATTNPYTISLADCEKIEKKVSNEYGETKPYKFYTFDNGLTIDTFRAAVCTPIEEVWVAEQGDIWPETHCFQLSFGDKILADNNTINGPIYVQGDANTLKFFDGDTLRSYLLLTAFAIVPSYETGDTISQYQDAIFNAMWNGPVSEFGYAYVDVRCENEGERFDPDGSWHEGQDVFKAPDIAFKLPVGENHVTITAQTYTTTRDFQQKGWYQFDYTVYVKCELPELPQIETILFPDISVCEGDVFVLAIDEPLYTSSDFSEHYNDYRIKYSIKYDNHTFQLNNEREFELHANEPGRHDLIITRTDACKRVSRDSASINVLPKLPRMILEATPDVCLGDTVQLHLVNWQDLEMLSEGRVKYTIFDMNNQVLKENAFIDGQIFYQVCSNLDDNGFIVRRIDACGWEEEEVIEFHTDNCEDECPNDTIHIKPLSFDIVQNGVCDFSLVYTLKNAEGCTIHYAIDLNMEDCDGNEDASTIDLTIDGQYVVFNEETKVAIFSIDGRKMYDGKYSNVRLESGIYIITTANAYRKVIIP